MTVSNLTHDQKPRGRGEMGKTYRLLKEEVAQIPVAQH